MNEAVGHILVADDNRMNRLRLTRSLEQQGHRVVAVENGLDALKALEETPFDLLLLDILMPGMDGYAVLEKMNADPALREIPVIVISAVDEMESIIRCIQLGADDYLMKPFDSTLLRARIGSSLAKKRWRDQEQAYIQQIEHERQKSDRLLHNILPAAIARRLKEESESIADSFDAVSVLFADIVGFTQLSTQMEPSEIVRLLNRIFSSFDQLAEKHSVEKIKTIGDAYMVVGGLPAPQIRHAEVVAGFALDAMHYMDGLCFDTGLDLRLRIGMHTGPAVAGVIGTVKFAYDLWGDTVNIASRMESHGVAGKIQVSRTSFEHLEPLFELVPRGEIEIKGKGNMATFFLIGRKKEQAT